MSTVITPFQGTDSFSTATFNNRISQINTGFSYISNPNLLDNWYFGNPVNQRGQTSYTGAGYGIDRWYLSAGTLLIKDGYVQVTGGSFSERFETAKIIDGQIYTASWLTYEGKLHTASGVLSKDSTGWQIDHWDGNVFMGVTKNSSDTFRSEISDSTGNPINLKAAKLELGSTQTLAHQDADGNWQLNEIPDFGEQLARCQRYCFVWDYGNTSTSCLAVFQAYTATNAFGIIPTPVTLRANPVVSGGVLTAGGKTVNLSGIVKCANGVRAIATVSDGNLTVGQAVGIENGNDNDRVVFSADL